MIFVTAKYAYDTMLFSAPFILCSMLFSLLHIFFGRLKKKSHLRLCRPILKLHRETACSWLSARFIIPGGLILAQQPQWLTIPARGLLYRNRDLRGNRFRQDQLLHVPLRRAGSRIFAPAIESTRRRTRPRSKGRLLSRQRAVLAARRLRIWSRSITITSRFSMYANARSIPTSSKSASGRVSRFFQDRRTRHRSMKRVLATILSFEFCKSC